MGRVGYAPIILLEGTLFNTNEQQEEPEHAHGDGVCVGKSDTTIAWQQLIAAVDKAAGGDTLAAGLDRMRVSGYPNWPRNPNTVPCSNCAFCRGSGRDKDKGGRLHVTCIKLGHVEPPEDNCESAVPGSLSGPTYLDLAKAGHVRMLPHHEYLLRREAAQ